MSKWYTLIVAVLVAFVSVFIKVLARRAGDDSPERNDWYVGQSLLLGALSVSSAYLLRAIVLERKDDAVDLELINSLLCFFIIVMAYVDKKFGWEQSQAQVWRRRIGPGVILPNSLGFGWFMVVFLFARWRLQ